MRLIPGKTKVSTEFFKGVKLADILVGGLTAAVSVLLLTSSIPGRLYIIGGIVMFAILLLTRIDQVPNYQYIMHIIRHLSARRNYGKVDGSGKTKKSDKADSSESDEPLLTAAEKKTPGKGKN